jgi:Helix-turn-helix domain
MAYPEAAWERAMTVQEVILKALSGEIHWYRAADILGFSPRRLRRWREQYEKHGYVALVDKRRHRPSVRRVAAPDVERLLRLYREWSDSAGEGPVTALPWVTAQTTAST